MYFLHASFLRLDSIDFKFFRAGICKKVIGDNLKGWQHLEEYELINTSGILYNRFLFIFSFPFFFS